MESCGCIKVSSVQPSGRMQRLLDKKAYVHGPAEKHKKVYPFQKDGRYAVDLAGYQVVSDLSPWCTCLCHFFVPFLYGIPHLSDHFLLLRAA